ncbi:MAG TPA: hypothetical protein VN107_02655 [Microbacterium sp.]|nr:hypothetical protein [Microbacterium sp.]
MSAQFMHAGAQSMPCIEHTVHACSQAAHASMHRCIMAMSMAGIPGIDIMSPERMASIIIESTPHLSFRRIRQADAHLAPA